MCLCVSVCVCVCEREGVCVRVCLVCIYLNIKKIRFHQDEYTSFFKIKQVENETITSAVAPEAVTETIIITLRTTFSRN